MDRRKFLQGTAGTIGGLAAMEALSPMLGAAQTARPDIAVASGASAEKIVQAAIDALGGVRRFISRGDVVVVKPNMAWDREPKFAANTNPSVVAAIVKMCLNAGAKTVKVFDRTCHDMRRAYVQSGIEAAAKAAGAEVFYVGGRRLSSEEERMYVDTKFSDGVAFKSWPILKVVLEADKLINVPIAKQHSDTKLSLTMKNWMGVMGGDRGRTHQNLYAAIADLATVIKPHLAIIDAVNILTANGPTGGNVNDVKRMNTVIAGVDQVALDSYAATLFGMTGDDLETVKEAAKRGLGQKDLTKLNIRKLQA